jgi:outer membrane receptor protein involved in Fe transport
LGLICTISSLYVQGEELSQGAANSEATEVIELIVVTGSRIPREGFESLQPTTVLDADALRLRGNLNIADSLNEQPGFGLPGNSPVAGQGDFGSVGQNFVNFLGLGAQRTLTLVNGHRFPPGIAPNNGAGGLQVDFNAIPTAIVDRIETVSIGGAPIYGTDAIAGTVNVILKDDYEGLEIFSAYGQSPEFGDAEEYQVGATWGTNFADGRGNLVLSAEYNRTDGLKQTDRQTTSTLYGFEQPVDPNSPYTLQLYEDLIIAVEPAYGHPLFFGDMFFLNLFGNGIPLDISDPASPLSAFDANGNLIPFIPGGGTGSPIFQSGGDGLNLASLFALNSELERYHANAFFTFDVNDLIRLKAEAWFARTDAVQVVQQPDYNSSAFGGLPSSGYGDVQGGPIPILINNPFLPNSTRNTLLAAMNVVQDFDGDGFADPTIDTDGNGLPDAVGFWRSGPLYPLVGDNPNSSRRDTVRLVLGLEGEIDWRDRSWIWDASVAYGETRSKDSNTTLLQTHMDQALQVVIDGNGNPACVDPSGGCAPLDIVGTPSAAAIAFVTEAVTNRIEVKQTVISANVSGELIDLPAGALNMAAGMAFRKEQAEFRPNHFALTGQARYPLKRVSGKFDSTEFYVESVIPLLGGQLDTPGVDRLEIEVAARWVDNSVAGSDVTWTAGIRYSPIADFEFRGNFTQSIRAPSITELFTPESQSIEFADDPCDQRFIGIGDFADHRAANCAADGIVQPFNSFIVDASQFGTVAGNDQLENEVADSYTIGVIFRPQSIDGLTVSADWLNIEIDQAISSLSAEDALTSCYESASFPDNPLCDRFTRDSNGQVIDFQSGYVNISQIKFSGLQTAISYDTSLGNLGNLRLALNHLYTDENTVTRGTANPTPRAGEIGFNDHRATASLTWSKGRGAWFTQLRYLSSAVFDNADQAFTRDVSGVDDWYVFDTSFSFDLTDRINLRFNIDNVFDEEAPYGATANWTGSGQAHGVVTYYSGILGRMVGFTVRANF